MQSQKSHPTTTKQPLKPGVSVEIRGCLYTGGWVGGASSSNIKGIYKANSFRAKQYHIARFMGPTWGPLGADQTQVGPTLAPWTLLSGVHYKLLKHWQQLHYTFSH